MNLVNNILIKLHHITTPSASLAYQLEEKKFHPFHMCVVALAEFLGRISPVLVVSGLRRKFLKGHRTLGVAASSETAVREETA